MSILGKLAKYAASADNILTGGKVTNHLINTHIQEYGEMLELKLDNRNRTVRCSILLNGETEPIELVVDEYIIDNGAIEVLKASSDRPWLDAVINNFIVGRKFPLPEKSAGFLSSFLG